MSRRRRTRAQKRMEELALTIVWWVALVCFLLCAAMLLVYQSKTGSEKDKLSSLAQTVATELPKDDAATQEQIDAQVLQRYATLAQQNSDLAGWISLDDTAVSYPVMQTKQDPEHYLRRDFDRKYSLSGLPFADAACDLNAGGNNIILYGHNMKNNTMFAFMEEYKEKSYCEQRPLIRFDTLQSRGQYRVFSVVVVDTAVTNPEALAAYRFKTGGTQEEFDSYISYLKEHALYDTGVQPQYGDSLLTLSTCTNRVDTERLVLVAVRQ